MPERSPNLVQIAAAAAVLTFGGANRANPAHDRDTSHPPESSITPRAEKADGLFATHGEQFDRQVAALVASVKDDIQTLFPAHKPSPEDALHGDVEAKARVAVTEILKNLREDIVDALQQETEISCTKEHYPGSHEDKNAYQRALTLAITTNVLHLFETNRSTLFSNPTTREVLIDAFNAWRVALDPKSIAAQEKRATIINPTSLIHTADGITTTVEAPRRLILNTEADRVIVDSALNNSVKDLPAPPGIDVFTIPAPWSP